MKHWPFRDVKVCESRRGEQSILVAERAKGWTPAAEKEHTSIQDREEKAEESDSIMQELPNDC